MKIDDLKQQKEATRLQLKMAEHHASCIQFDASTMSSFDSLIKQAEKGTEEAKKLKKMVEEFHQPEKN